MVDFQDILSKFEEHTSNPRGDRPKSARDNAPQNLRNEKPDLTHYEPDLRILCEELLNHILLVQNKAPLAEELRSAGFSKVLVASGIRTQFFLNELRTVLANLRNSNNFATHKFSPLSSSEPANIDGTKLMSEERTEQLEEIKSHNKEIENNRYQLEETVPHLCGAYEKCKTKHSPIESELQELIEEKVTLFKKCKELEKAEKCFNSERTRFHNTIARCREELLLATHQTERAELEAKQAVRHAKEVEKRAEESTISSVLISARLKELRDVQGAMAAAMMEATETGEEIPAIQGNRADLGYRRSGLVSRVSNLLKTRRRSRNVNDGHAAIENKDIEQQISSYNWNGTNIESAILSTPFADSPAHPKNEEVSSETAQESNRARASRRKSLTGRMRRFKNNLTRVASNRNAKRARRSVLANIEKSRQVIENDTLLREVIETKEIELERLTVQHFLASEKAAALEQLLKQEHHNHSRLGSRIVHAPGEQKQSQGPATSAGSTNLNQWHENKETEKHSTTGIQHSGFNIQQTIDQAEHHIAI